MGSLALQLKDFVIPGRLAGTSEADQGRPIEISYQTLTKYLNEVEEEYEVLKGD